MEGVDPIEIVDETQCVQDIMDDIVSEEKQNEGTSSNVIDKMLEDLVENDMKKLIFKTPVECEVFYFTYAKTVGFGVKREAPRMNHHGIVTSLCFCCDCEGVRSEKDKNREDKKRKPRDETRCFCKAFISMKYMKTTCQYIVKEFKKEHNHHLATYHPHVDVDKLDDDTLMVTCFIAHIGFDCSEVLNNFIFCLLLYWLIAENQATNGCIGRDRDCHRRLAYGITHLKVVRTPYYMCPELLADIPNGFISHIWSFGMPLSFAVYIKLGTKFLSDENMVLQSNVEDISAARASVDRELIEKKSLLELGNTLGHLNELVESLKSNLDKVSCERDHLQKEIMILEGKVETTYALANENAAIAAEAQEIAESRRVYAEEKEEEVKFLEESREELELELHALNHKMQNVESTDADVKRHLDEKARNLQEALKHIKILEKDLANKDTEIAQCKAHILELTVHAEAEASEYKYKDSFFMFNFAEVHMLFSSVLFFVICSLKLTLSRSWRQWLNRLKQKRHRAMREFQQIN
ncbi:hypothetical protein Cgig2_034122 [Carnegiea gigantea]|uniref:FAR1 domain-containing protein n=1 Tax=Carnegiea gigantea TaxID=171969 RepID=A0A9Q1KEH5_9CARY|nr:hypothetical protein Cgig2_034122 [Carnegiea gigantea]